MSSRKQGVALVIAVLGALGLVALIGRRAEPPGEKPLIGNQLLLGQFIAIEGTDISRAGLYDSSGGSYGSGYSRTRNVLFIEKTGKAHWLLPDDDHLVTEYPVPPPARAFGETPERAVAVFAHVTPLAGKRDEGVLLLFDPAGTNIQTVAERVRGVQGVSLGSEITAMYQVQSGYVLARFDRSSLAKLGDAPVSFPVLR